MSDNLKFFKGNEADLPIANSGNAGSIYHCEDTGNTYLSNGDQMILFASAVGKKDSAYKTSEIFTDYEGNKVCANNATVMGPLGYNWSQQPIIKKGSEYYRIVQGPIPAQPSSKAQHYVSSNNTYVQASYCHTVMLDLMANATYTITYTYYSANWSRIPNGSPLVFFSTQYNENAVPTSKEILLTKSTSTTAHTFTYTPTKNGYLYVSYTSSSPDTIWGTPYYNAFLIGPRLSPLEGKNGAVFSTTGDPPFATKKSAYTIEGFPENAISTNINNPTMILYQNPRIFESAPNAVVSGIGTIATDPNQSVRGQYNKIHEGTYRDLILDAVGNGTASNRSDAYYLTEKGDGYYSGHLFSKGLRVSSTGLAGNFYNGAWVGEDSDSIYIDKADIGNFIQSVPDYLKPGDYIYLTVDYESVSFVLYFEYFEQYYNFSDKEGYYVFSGEYENKKITITLHYSVNWEWNDEEGTEQYIDVYDYTYTILPINESNIKVASEVPDDSVGENGDLYIIPHNYTLPAIYSGTSLPTSAIGVDGDIYILYSEE